VVRPVKARILLLGGLVELCVMFNRRTAINRVMITFYHM
jgi:hypothetical protein